MDPYEVIALVMFAILMGIFLVGYVVSAFFERRRTRKAILRRLKC